MLRSNSNYLTDLLTRHVHESSESPTIENVEFTLADLMIVSKVSLTTGETTAAQVESHLSVSDDVDCRGKIVKVQAVVSKASESGKHKCPRCWKWTSLLEGALCSRCQLVLS